MSWYMACHLTFIAEEIANVISPRNSYKWSNFQNWERWKISLVRYIQQLLHSATIPEKWACLPSQELALAERVTLDVANRHL